MALVTILSHQKIKNIWLTGALDVRSASFLLKDKFMKRKKMGRMLSSIHLKIAVVFALTLLATLELVGAFFIRQLEQQNLTSFRNQITLPAYVSDSLTQALTESGTTNQVNSDIHHVLSNINNTSISNVEVIDAKGVIRGTTDINDQDVVGQRTTDQNVQNALNNRNYVKMPIEKENNIRYQLVVKPLVNEVNGNNTTVGVVVVRASLETIYDNLSNISQIYLGASLLAVIVGTVMAVIISRALTKPIAEISERTMRIAQGDYSGEIPIESQDEIGHLADNVNSLALRIEETTNSMDFERRRLDSVLEHMTDGVMATDRRGRINLINATAARMINQKEDVRGQSVLDILNIRERYSLRELLDEHDELMLDFSRGHEQRILMAYFSLIQRESGFISGLVIVLHDITEQQQIERERRDFVSNVSHELRTPLTSVKSYVDALRDGAINDEELSGTFLGVVQDETERMIKMINDLLELSRMDSGTVRLEPEFVNMTELVNYILNRFDMIIANADEDAKRYTINRQIMEDPVWVEIDPSKLTQVIDNIMNNAIKYSPDGGVVTVKMQEIGQKLVLSISDQGLGIPQKDLPYIFDRFFRVDKARSRKQGGTGLGLAISKELVRRSGGQIWAESEEGKGSTFYVAFPFTKLDDEGEWDE